MDYHALVSKLKSPHSDASGSAWKQSGEPLTRCRHVSTRLFFFLCSRTSNGYGWVGVIVLEGFENDQIEPLGPEQN